ncbi:uncharacterized protein LOC122032535 isoform X1 [Zingiber officinale]|uniref:uncharacterized protein LOC122032535 isoform X1 n=1 Tax=Zingiber officinale TaxID=94328 RepID=UPI001C4C7D44|nr:uncharacterized protein LOC122032535 isoform X1 [Zingiber officinale]XP_042447779.1 uncharacterized protein LOC122032535 isoform X1 [Zingiber officinale]
MRVLAVLTLVMVSLSGINSASAATPSKIVAAAVSNVASSILKRFWSLKSTTRTAVPGHHTSMKFESGYTVETVFDGSKLGIEPYSVEVTQGGESLLLDSVNSNVYRISLPLSRYSRPKLVAGSPEGYVGHVDGRPREARMNHPKGFTVDERGNIYVADTMNMVIRKISNTGVTTIAGGKWGGRVAHSDGASEDAKFSTDFEVVYVASSCSLLVVDRGDQAIREVQLNVDDCAYQYETGFPSGITVLLAAGFFGYILALLQWRVGLMVSSKDVDDHVQENQANCVQEHRTPIKTSMPPYRRQMKTSLRPPLIPTGEDTENADDEGLLSSTGKLISRTWFSTAEIFGSLFPIFRRKPKPTQYQQQQQQPKVNTWPMPESFVIPDDEIPPPVEARAPAPRKTYAFMSKEPEKIHHVRHPRTYTNGWKAEPQKQVQQVHQQQLQQHRHHSSGPQTYFEQSCETSNEIVFGAVQELESKRQSVEIKAVNYGDPIYEQYGMRYRNGYMGYANY